MSMLKLIPCKPLYQIEIPLLAPALLLTGLLSGGCGNESSTGQPSHGSLPPSTTATISYVDCSAASNGTGTQSNPWNTLASVSATIFNPGDEILFNRGTTCSGVMAPLGSGTAASPIVIDAYGTGPQPIIDGGMNNAAVELNNQQGWEINNLEIVGGNFYGVYIAGIIPNTTFTHFRLTNLNVHGAHYTSVTAADSGEVFFGAGTGDAFNDVVINGVVAHDSTVFEGIFIDGGDAWGSGILGNNVTVENSSAYDVYGQGILIQATTNGLLQNNVVHNSGQCPPKPGCGTGTPSGLWELYCHICTIQGNESYDNQDWSLWDGGDYDIDVWNNNNIVQYNYGHDSVGYCVAVFSAQNAVGTDNVIRYNVCSNNSRLVNSPDPGEIFMNTWAGGSLNGIQIYNNTFYWNPATPGPAFNTTDASFTGADAKFFKNNILYSTVPGLIQTTTDFALDNNIYWTVGAAPDWNINGTDYADLGSYLSASGEDANSLYADPMLNTPAYHSADRPVTAFTLMSGSPAFNTGVNVCSGISGCSMGTQDFWGNPLPNGAGYNIGAWQ
jgi:hypothetical protein